MPSSPAPVSSTGGTGSLNVSAARECVWSATSEAAWLTITSEPSGQGNGTITYAVAGNPAPAVRRGALAVGSQRTEIVQSAAPCEFVLKPPAQSFGSAGGEGIVGVETMEGCSWTAASGAPWIAITASEHTSGPGTLRFRIDANTGDARASAITIAGLSFAVTQSGSSPAPCSFAIDPTTHVAPAEGGAASVAVSATAGCAWTVASQASWITITNGPNGTGSGTVNVRVAPNSGPLRVGTVTIANAIYTVTQAASLVCSYTITPQTFAAPSGASTTTVAVTTANGCAWTAVSQAGWIAITNGASGNGNGTVSLTIAANGDGARSGTVTIGGQTFTVNQAAITCTYAISPTALAAPAAGGTATVTVTAPGGCAWSASSQAPWIGISGGGGSGAGTVNLTIGVNGGAARSGTATIANQTYTVTQAAAPAPCTYAIAPTEQSVPAMGGPVTVAVTTQPGCTWTADSQTSWIAVVRGSPGTGNGTVEMTVAGNAGPARSASIPVAGLAFTVNQAAEPPPCTYTLDPTAQAVPSTGGEFSVVVNTQAGCSWALTITVPWISLIDNTPGPATGVGPGSVKYRVSPNNTSSPRVGTLETSGQVLTVTQAWPF